MDHSEQPSLNALRKQILRMTQYFSALGIIEFKSAVFALIVIGAAAVALLLLFFTLWLCGMSALAFLLLAKGCSWYSIAFLLGVLQILFMVPLVILIRFYSKRLLFPKTQQALDIFIQQ